MRDVQAGPDFRRMPIQKVGIRNIRYPVTVRDKSRETQETVASVTLSVNLPHSYRGTHMSRFVEVLDKFRDEVSYHTLEHDSHGDPQGPARGGVPHRDALPVFPADEGARLGAGVPHVLRLHDLGSLRLAPRDRHARRRARAHPLPLLARDLEGLRAQPARHRVHRRWA